MKRVHLVIIISIFATTSAAHAYVGPGMAAGAIASLLGILGAIFLAIVGILYYPIKRVLKKKKSGAETAREPENKK